MADTLIEGATILTMDPERRILEDGWIAVSADRIEAIGTAGEDAPHAERVIEGRRAVVTPGLISTHQHVIDVLLRGGLEQDRTLFDWLVNVYFAGTSAYTPEDCGLAVRLNMAEAVSAGVTTVTDNWGVNNGDSQARVDECAAATLEAYEEVGVRVLFARMFSDVFPPEWERLVGALSRKLPGKTLRMETLLEPADRALSAIEELMGAWRAKANGRIRVCPAPIMAQIVSEEALAAAHDLAKKHDTVLPIHHCESPVNARVFPESGVGMSGTEYLHVLGLLDERTLGAHCVWLSDRDIRLLGAFGANVAHCPSCNMFAASGISPIPRLLESGVTVGLGTDDANANSNVSILLEMRHAALLAKVGALDGSALTAEKVLEMGTIDGARAIGLEHEIGSLEPGKKADLVLWDTDKPHWHPRHQLPSVLVYQAHTSDVKSVMIDGRLVLDDGELDFAPGDELRALSERAQHASEAIIERAGMQRLLERGWQSRGLI
ncbi:MAG TPA: amidohydrolase [Thermoleophilaceae bacterium]|nr:amidohydrolase [Thermoleophilaceae bacterium]